MNGVLGRPTLLRQDIAIGIGRDQELGFRWYKHDGTNKTLVDVRGRTATVRFESLTGELWKEFPANIYGDSLVSIKLTAASLVAPEWAGRYTGAWSLRISDSTSTVQVASGYLYLSQ
ncbi:hypothetical protein [Lysinibacter cavernae]|uniref:Uncharacterized protein n=1 Tax=Lysinibacter cavernae TaxID=1640652 RepID=A0A7X5TS58_9MICO|nr:hypothetical protein [Lysinibacter cavernae]NIH52555.1 hypothetical protein [Lysinibacter cavernae]